MYGDILDEASDTRPTPIPPLGLGGTVLLFGAAALLLFAATHGVIPYLTSRTGIEPVLLWFLAGGLGVFAPLLVISLVLLQREARPNPWGERLWLRPMTRSDWLWSLGALALVGVLGAGTLLVLRLLWGEVHLHPPFLMMPPLTPERYWILAAWLPFWGLNIFGEELLWRGVVLPRQEVAFGRWAWFANGAGWFLFHLAFGATILFTVWPILFILPYVVQRRRNSWIGVVVHAGLNGPGFVAVAFGLV